MVSGPSQRYDNSILIKRVLMSITLILYYVNHTFLICKIQKFKIQCLKGPVYRIYLAARVSIILSHSEWFWPSKTSGEVLKLVSFI